MPALPQYLNKYYQSEFGLNEYDAAQLSADKEIAERSVVVALEDNMLTVPEPSTGKQNGQVRIVVNVGIAHAAAVEHHGAIQQTLAILLPGGEAR